MSVEGLIRRARDLGLRLWIRDGKLLVAPGSALTPDLRGELAERRAEIITCLRLEPPEEGRLLDRGRRWVPPPKRPGWCPCGQERAEDPASGLCRTCFSTVHGKKIPSRLMRGER
jgi:hypothetical protein